MQNFPTEDQAKKAWASEVPAVERAAIEGKQSPVPATKGRVTGEKLPDPKEPKGEQMELVEAAIDQTAPMTPAEIRKFREQTFDRAKEAAVPPGGPYEIKGRRLARVNMEPGALPVTVDVALGMGCFLTFVDRSGTPLLIDGAKSFSSAFDVSQLPSNAAKTTGVPYIEIMPKSAVGRGMVMVVFEGVVKPISIQVRVGAAKSVDTEVEVVVPVTAVQATVLPGDRGQAALGLRVAELQGFLSGVAPESAAEAKVKGVGDTSAWVWNNRLYLRTVHTVFSPGWFAHQASSDGTAVYEMPVTSVVRLGVGGRSVDAVIELPFIPPLSANKK